MMQRGLVCLLLSGLAWGQGTAPGSAVAPPPASSAASPPAGTTAAANAKPEVPADAAVITIVGSCDPPAANPSDCKTVITRAEFEQVVNAIAPAMPATAKKQFAGRYATALVMARKAHEMGADQGPKFDEMMKLARMQVAAQQLTQALQAKAADVPDKDVEDYYNKNLAAYQEANLQRVFIPKNRQEAPKEKADAADTEKGKAGAGEDMKALAEKLRARAAAGEPFATLQLEAYQAAGFKTSPPQAAMNKVRRNALPATQATVFDLKTGEVSPLIVDVSGYYIYKMDEKDTIPLAQVHDEIFNSLKTQRYQEQMQGVQQSATPALNPDYFGAAQPVPQGVLRDAPRGTAQPKPPSLGPQ